MDCLRGYRLDPSSGKNFRVAVVLFTKADEKEGLHIHKLEYVDLEQVKEAVLCMQKQSQVERGRPHGVHRQALSLRRAGA